MNLVIFDIDGTLLRSVELDDTCFVRAFADVLGIDGLSADWARYEHVTDSGLAREIVRRHRGRDPTDEEMELLAQRSCQLLRRATARSPGAIRAVAGAGRLIEWLGTGAEWRTAIASGSWLATARIKLEAAGLALDDLPAAFADDSPDRSEILRAAIVRASRCYAAAGFGKVVYVGDGAWDVEAARRLGIAFVGMAGRGGAGPLVAAGAATVLSDFLQPDAVLAALASARVPP